MSDEKLSPAELEAAGKIHDKVVQFLSTRYLTIMILIGIASPIIGILVGAIVESRLFSASRDALLESAKSDVTARVESAKTEATKAEERIRAASDEARGYLDQIRSTRAALDFVLQGTPTGEKTLLQERSIAVQNDIEEFRGKLDAWESQLKKDIPDGLSSLNASADNLRQLQEAVSQLKTLFDTTQEAGALAGAFYKVYELLGDFELALYVTQQTYDADFLRIESAQEKITASVAFFRTNHEEEQKILEWAPLLPMIKRANLVEQAPVIDGSGPPSKTQLLLTFTLANMKPWWEISESNTEKIKRVNLRHCTDFDTVRVTLRFPKELEDVQTTFVKCMLSRKGEILGAPTPLHLRFKANVNRVEIDLRHINPSGPEIRTPYFGKVTSTSAEAAQDAKPAVAAAEGVIAQEGIPAKLARDGEVILTFPKTSLFSTASTAYIQGLQQAPNGEGRTKR
ncbi:MAG: hypothetical protein H0T47_02475 [Planctomycetaceae bacterium]|nr:hypothetical protein [Planctomycetaceae bacterium]